MMDWYTSTPILKWLGENLHYFVVFGVLGLLVVVRIVDLVRTNRSAYPELANYADSPMETEKRDISDA
jgi:hypothetical protein